MDALEQETVSDQEIFNEATTETKPEEAPKEERNTEEVKEDRLRDEQGRFTKQEEETPVVEVKAEPELDKQDHRIPLTELLNEREKRQAAERKAEMIEQQTSQRIAQLQRQFQEATKKPEEPIDIFAQPEAYQQSVEQRMSQKLREMEGNFSLRIAVFKHGDLFKEAWSEMVSRSNSGDDSLRQQVLSSADPGETLVTLYKREKVAKEVGDDPAVYRNKVREEALNDPEFLAKALEKARGVAGTQPTQIKLPPSLNKATASASTDTDDMSDRSLYSFATR